MSDPHVLTTDTDTIPPDLIRLWQERQAAQCRVDELREEAKEAKKNLQAAERAVAGYFAECPLFEAGKADG